MEKIRKRYWIEKEAMRQNKIKIFVERKNKIAEKNK